MQRPHLDKIEDGFIAFEPGTVSYTMSVGQWDELLNAAYHQGDTLIELNDDGIPIAAYRKKDIPEARAE